MTPVAEVLDLTELAVAAGLADVPELAGTELDGARLAGTGLAGTGLAGVELAGVELADPDDPAGAAELADLIDLEHEVAWLEHFRRALARRQARWWQWDAAMTGTDRQERAIWACEQELRQARERLSAARGEF